MYLVNVMSDDPKGVSGLDAIVEKGSTVIFSRGNHIAHFFGDKPNQRYNGETYFTGSTSTGWKRAERIKVVGPPSAD